MGAYVTQTSNSSSTITGSGTANTIAMFTSPNTVGDSPLSVSGTKVKIANTYSLTDSSGNSFLQLGLAASTPAAYFYWDNTGGTGADTIAQFDTNQFYFYNSFGSFSISAALTSINGSGGQFTCTTAGVSANARGIQINSSLIYAYHATKIQLDSPIVNMTLATASTIAIFDASKNLISAATATYPSLTELIYVKGVTSAIQTQFANLNLAASLTDVTVTSPTIDQFLRYNGTKWVNGNNITVNAGSGVDFYPQTTASDIATYNVISKTPQNVAAQDITATANNNKVLIQAYASDSAGLGGTQIDAGTWNFDIWGYVGVVGVGTSSIDVDMYSRTAAGTETLLFTVNSGTLSVTTDIYSISSVQQAFTLNAATDRLVMKVSAKTTSVVNRVIHYVFGGTANYSNVNTPLVIRHNDLAGLQGGTSAQYFHLTSAEYTGTGTGNFVRTSNAVLIAPTLGVATATSYNGLTITTTTGSFTLTNAKTLSVTATLTLSGTDSTTITFQGTDTYVGRTTTDIMTNKTFTTPIFSSIVPTTAGSFGYDGTVFYSVSSTGAVGISPSVMYSIVPAGDFSLSTSTGVQSAFPTTGDVWTLNAATTYYIEGLYFITKSGTTCTIALAFALAGGASVTSILYQTQAGAQSVNTANATIYGTTVNQVSSTVINATTATGFWIQFFGHIRMNAGGTVTPQINFNASPTNPVMTANSYIRFTPVGTNTNNIQGNVG